MYFPVDENNSVRDESQFRPQGENLCIHYSLIMRENFIVHDNTVIIKERSLNIKLSHNHKKQARI